MKTCFTCLAAGLCTLLITSATVEAAPKRHLIWQDRAVGVPGLDTFKKIEASAWEVDPSSPLPIHAAPDAAVVAKGRTLRGIADSKTDRFWH